MSKVCPLCKNIKLFSPIDVIDSESRGYFVNKAYLECGNCGLIFRSKLVYDTSNMYKSEYQDYQDLNRLLIVIRKIIYNFRVRKISRLINKKSQILEIGCGVGDFLLALKSRGFNSLEGIEISRFATTIAVGRGLKVRAGDFLNLFIARNKYDLVVMQHVIEHFSNPDKVRLKLRRVLKLNGMAVITTPNIDSWQRKIFGKYWYGWQYPYHMVVYSPKHLEDMFERHGFEICGTEFSMLPNDIAGSIYNFLFFKYPSVRKFKYLKPLLLLLACPISIVEGLLRKSGRMTVIVKKIK